MPTGSNELKLEQERLQRKLDKTNSRLGGRRQRLAEEQSQGASNCQSGHHDRRGSVTIKRETIIFRQRERAYTNKVVLTRGDQVGILNPKKGQQDTWIIVGFYADNKLKIRTKNNSIITRLPKNTHYVEHVYTREYN